MLARDYAHMYPSNANQGQKLTPLRKHVIIRIYFAVRYRLIYMLPITGVSTGKSLEYVNCNCSLLALTHASYSYRRSVYRFEWCNKLQLNFIDTIIYIFRVISLWQKHNTWNFKKQCVLYIARSTITLQ